MLFFNKNDLNCSLRVWLRYRDMLPVSSRFPLCSGSLNFTLINNLIDSKGLFVAIILFIEIFNEILFYKKYNNFSVKIKK